MGVIVPGMTGGTSNSTEIEAKLVIAEGDREGVLRELLALRRLGPYLLIERPPREIHDRYFDTADGQLAACRVAFRLRRQDDRWALTVKGPARLLPGGAQERLEIERHWSAEAFAEILDELAALGVATDREPAGRNGATTPLEAIAAAGLKPLHEREVCRAVRLAALPTDPDHAVAEMALDAVTFRVGGRDLLHYEIEIEGLGADPAGPVGVAVEELRRRFGAALRPWLWDKLRLGIALEELESMGRLSRLVAASGQLLDAGYDAVEERLERG